jgi:amino acid transporter
MSVAITLLTALSLSALATNRGVEGGGAYYIISRSLGVEAGAAMGVPLYLAQTLGISFYVAGFSEALGSVYPDWDPRVVGTITLVTLAAVCYFSADLALRTQYLVMAIIGVSLISFFIGGGPAVSEPAVAPVEMPETLGFWVVFAVFFPAVTGIEAGLAMSGDLKDPSKSLPWGTLAAIGVGFAVYLAIPVWMSFQLRDGGEHQLLTNGFIMKDMARWGGVVMLGVWAATLSSAVGALLGAPRTLQALAKDGVVPAWVGKGYGPGNDPRFATGVSFMIALAGVLLGDLNVIAPILSMFFLISYGLLNTSAALESFANPPSWRPTFKTHWIISFAGALGCAAAMFMINAGATFVASFCVILIFLVMQRRRMQVGWGDIRSGVMTLLARYALLVLDDYEADARTWKPNILAFTGSPSRRWRLIRLASALSRSRGLLTVATILPEEHKGKRARKRAEAIRGYLQKRHVSAFVRTQASDDLYEGMGHMVRGYGFGPLHPNVALFGACSVTEKQTDFAKVLMEANVRQMNAIVVREPDEEEVERETGRRIVLWWSGMGPNVGLMTALAVMLQREVRWQDSTLEIHSLARHPDEATELQQRVLDFAAEARIDAEVRITTLEEGQTIFEAIHVGSKGADLVFMGMRPPSANENPVDYGKYYGKLYADCSGMPPLAWVLSAEALDFRKIFVEQDGVAPKRKKKRKG